MKTPTAGPITDPRRADIHDRWCRLLYPPFGLDLFFLNGTLSALDLYLDHRPPEPSHLPLQSCPRQVAEELRLYFQGHPVRFAFATRFLPPYTEFQVSVWKALQDVPRGQVRSYGWLANRVGRPQAARAVGGAVGRNPLPVIFPCHRIIESGGGLGGFSSGIEIKRLLLRLEGVSL